MAKNRDEKKVVKSVVFGADDQDLLAWAETHRNFSQLCKEALQDKRRGSQQSDGGIDPTRLARIVEQAVRRALAGLALVQADAGASAVTEDAQIAEEIESKIFAMF